MLEVSAFRVLYGSCQGWISWQRLAFLFRHQHSHDMTNLTNILGWRYRRTRGCFIYVVLTRELDTSHGIYGNIWQTVTLDLRISEACHITHSCLRVSKATSISWDDNDSHTDESSMNNMTRGICHGSTIMTCWECTTNMAHGT